MGIEIKIKQIASDVSGYDSSSISNGSKVTNYLDDLQFAEFFLDVLKEFSLPPIEDPTDLSVYTVQDIIDHVRSNLPSAGGDAFYNATLKAINSQFGVQLSSSTARRLGNFQGLVNFLYNARNNA